MYLDYAATTPPYEEVIETMAEVMRSYYGNPSSLHRAGVDAERLISQARMVIAQCLRCKPDEIVFTSGGTESNNMAIQGSVLQYKYRGNHLITSIIEHASVYDVFLQLEKQGFEVTYLPVDETGQVRLEDLRQALREDTILVSIMAVNNEMGRIQPIQEISRLLKALAPRAIFHVDAVQAIGKLEIEPEKLGIDVLSGSAHKLRGPKGTGFLYCRQGLELQPIVWGGGQEGGLRSGTENVPGIVGMAKAMRMACDQRLLFLEHTSRLREYWVRLIEQIPELQLSGSTEESDMAPYILHFSYPGMKSEVMVHALEKHHMYVSARSACSSGAEKPSRVLKAMGYSDARAVSGVRISYSLEQSIEDAQRFGEILKQVVQQLKPTIPLQQRQRRR
ncbi:cysteine desulfurase family protein [Paenibacillus rigui]|uniref:Cysteine desulfurase NifS n=1 Tax=Paenibacillus rigui TaxID=554312 RepID=A0A229USI5_9BACL|nr:cysteine desulfurase family protein [Paenibacillus rigui]OXM86085.1 cysteine desulfurase NifS [Paenibacillus rigui]